MKKILLLLLIIALCFSFCGCSETSTFMDYNKIHITTRQYSGCIEICPGELSYLRNSICVKTKEFGITEYSTGTYFLVEDECPICDKY